MAWGRLALIQVADDEDACQKMASIVGYESMVPEQRENNQKKISADVSGSTSTRQSATTQAKSQRPPARFLCVNRIQSLSENYDQAPAFINNPENQLKTDSSGGTYFFTYDQLITNAAKLAPFLLNELGIEKPNHRLDHQRLTRRIAQGKPLQRIPRYKRQRWPQQLLIIVDVERHLEPYLVDFRFIVDYLQRLLGKSKVAAIRFDIDTLDEEETYFQHWGEHKERAWHRWTLPPTDTRILLLSDLGAFQQEYTHQVRWQHFLKVFAHHSIVTLSPANQSPESERFKSDWFKKVKPNPLNDEKPLKRHSYRHGFNISPPSVDSFKKILTLLSALPLIDASLLRRLRVALNWGGSELEGTIWNHPDMQDIGLGLCMREKAAKAWQENWQDSPETEQFWQIVHDHHKDAFNGLKVLENVSDSALASKIDETAGHYLRCLSASLHQGGSNNTVSIQQAKTYLSIIPKTAWQGLYADELHAIYASSHAEEVRNGNMQRLVELGGNPAQLQYTLAEQERYQQTQWQVFQIGSQGQFILKKEGKQKDNAIAQLQALSKLPPTLSQGKHIQTVEPDVLYGFAENASTITLQSNQQQIELQAIEKPDWAFNCRQGTTGLMAEVLWAKGLQTVAWNDGDWQWQAPFGNDDYGLYGDVDIKGITLRFRWINAGNFYMGSPKEEVGRYDDEDLHHVTLTKGFWLAETTVTQALWQAVTNDNPAHFKGQNNPVEQVSWDDCQQFIQQLRTLEPNLAWQLPTEAEWEYACRTGTQTLFNFSDELDLSKVNYSGIFADSGWADQALQKTAPVKSYAPNAWGLYEMHGNVWEWCRDYWQENLGNKAETDPARLESGSDRVVRGGSWSGYGRSVRSAIRNPHSPGIRRNYFGMRLALGLPSYSLLNNDSMQAKSSQGSRADSRQPKAATVSTEALAADENKSLFDKL